VDVLQVPTCGVRRLGSSASVRSLRHAQHWGAGIMAGCFAGICAISHSTVFAMPASAEGGIG
jgi:hypothetical protein